MKNSSQSASECCWEHVSACFSYEGCQYNKQRQQCTKVSILRLTEEYLNVTINRNTRKREPEIGTDGFSKTRQNMLVDGHGYGFGPPRSSGSGVWTVPELNWTVCSVEIRTPAGLPGPIANTNQTPYKVNCHYIEFLAALDCMNFQFQKKILIQILLYMRESILASKASAFSKKYKLVFCQAELMLVLMLAI